jgi:hypothetical protein
MKVNKIHDGIYEIEEFITQLEVDSILKTLDSGEWQGLDSGSHWEKRIKKINPRPEELNDICKRISNLFLSYGVVNNIQSIQRFEVGGSMGVHIDKMPSNNVRYGMVCYLNDNYTGGEVYYPDLGIEIKPKLRSLVIHKGDIRHGVKEVLSGSDRYFLTTFAQADDSNEVVLKSFE